MIRESTLLQRKPSWTGETEQAWREKDETRKRGVKAIICGKFVRRRTEQGKYVTVVFP